MALGEKHFLNQTLSFIEVVEEEGKNNAFESFLKLNKVPMLNSEVNWSEVKPHFQFMFDYQKNEIEIKEWFKQSALCHHEFLITWLVWEDPIIKIKTVDFLDHWEALNVAAAWEGITLITEDSSLIIEFTDDHSYLLNSNFPIKPNSEKL